ncbi:hypothetical protein SELMODRAFT_153186 [Selaginella moellendorffii]|uniref:tRNA (guanine(26)-N(2))-dimethyltransferase n=2 Tax=Selaginella moellendorffii TaxID=88036 RepID=D8S7D4_SELML|nr:hypothetical protein SELMODRAFT_159602 [Selaginella moellendorffii]EFJ19738.1 hypothetical protein SELMODRAFT_153186 [Selaginella moellendorffii]
MSIAVLRSFIAKRQEEHIARQAAIKARNSKAATEEVVEVNGSAGETSTKVEATSSSENNIAKPIRVLEALAASGLRALRYAREVEGIASVLALDSDKVAVEACARNIKLNGSVAASKVEAQQADSRVYMLTHEKQFDVVDLDPYGSPSIFLDSAVQTIADGGMLMCTATDMAVLCGNNGEVCYSKYGSYSLRAKYCHEMALRILLATIESHANRYKRHIVPVLSLSVDFYIRVFVRIYTSANAMKQTPSKLAYVYQCVGCDNFCLQPLGRIVQKNNSTRYLPGLGPTVQQQCEHCGKNFNMGGPMWAAPIHDTEWVSAILSQVCEAKKRYPAFDKIHSILTSVSEELIDVPLYLSIHELSATLKCTPPSAIVFRSAVLNAGYRISGTHASPLGFKTDAPMEVIWDIMRCWVKEHPVKAQKEETPGTIILSKEAKLQADFSRARGAQSKAQMKGVARFLPNPEENWGPKVRAGRHIKPKHGNLLNTATEGKSFENPAESDDKQKEAGL